MNIEFAAKQTTSSFLLVQAGEDFAGYKIGTDVMMSLHKAEKKRWYFLQFQIISSGVFVFRPHWEEQASAMLRGALSSRTPAKKDRCFKKISISEFPIETRT